MIDHAWKWYTTQQRIRVEQRETEKRAEGGKEAR